MVIDWRSGQFLAVTVGRGRTHDLRLWRESAFRLAPDRLCLADSGYQGLARDHEATILPKRKPPRKCLPEVEKACNRALAAVRIRIEHAIRRLKRFRIFSGRYRNRRRRCGLRLHLLAGLLNYQATHPI
ncbi:MULTISPECIES: transposase family protein [unclassified Limnothrix]|uniref:transposase family protein n=1 Tax=unclassified Limnothrix TaxID=2632864 RepID=UPI001F54D5BC|nr:MULTISPECIES: transposase family protein [unclassified Limnothrix]